MISASAVLTTRLPQAKTSTFWSLTQVFILTQAVSNQKQPRWVHLPNLPKKDLGMIAMSYGNVYVAQVALGANDMQTIKAFNEAEAYDGPSIIIAYCPCINQGLNMADGLAHQKDAVETGSFPIYRYKRQTG